ncbi:LLM class flavin-dependent oxidoreductase [Mycobacterium nebraskense]|uniref:Luciferase n=1 Tax=Mycobacterium nebraskense TaxID=244292 RepID=A0A0F5NGK9_9MYCO|nr:LLM class flavin-dependent oxidoreductase [Mycobacterium nebraskense]KKC06196.1 luciferase [Mycobacterium nebraskense]KLO34771.1 luciferase [Mycobacterium nebraskense]MBI2695996.1 LLM class flavin-dependent oxidoreductase [Mycobacterium nebraskense]MCV7116417.1 LLM class flavin-dependent oxidoreductase [Mycobacterium nebraskense]ORW34801.1 luciferase [Mycobacterium nebraskense]
MFTLRFDMRAPDWAGPAADLYAAAIDMCAWAETRGAVLAVLSEHHGAEDGHLPAPLTLASAIAARTHTLAILLAAVPIPLWDPVRLAEEMSVLDLISRGRVSYAFGVGHRREEYDHFGVDMATRGRAADEILAVLRPLVCGEPVEYHGRTIRVTPACGSPGGPMMLIAGGSKAAARRAGRYGLGFVSQTEWPGLKEFYEAQCRAHGHEPGMVQFPVGGVPTAVFVADNLDEAWHVLGPHLLHDAVMAASYRPHDDSVASITRADSVAALREEGGGPYRVLTSDEATDYVRGGRPLPLHPLCGGLAPDVAWPYLERAAAAAARAHAD